MGYPPWAWGLEIKSVLQKVPFFGQGGGGGGGGEGGRDSCRPALWPLGRGLALSGLAVWEEAGGVEEGQRSGVRGQRSEDRGQGAGSGEGGGGEGRMSNFAIRLGQTSSRSRPAGAG